MKSHQAQLQRVPLLQLEKIEEEGLCIDAVIQTYELKASYKRPTVRMELQGSQIEPVKHFSLKDCERKLSVNLIQHCVVQIHVVETIIRLDIKYSLVGLVGIKMHPPLVALILSDRGTDLRRASISSILRPSVGRSYVNR